VFVGEQGAEALDLSGEGHGTVTRILRNFEALMVQMAGDSHKRVDAALKTGGVALAVLMDGKEAMKDEVATLVKRQRGKVIRYWSRWTIEAMDSVWALPASRRCHIRALKTRLASSNTECLRT